MKPVITTTHFLIPLLLFTLYPTISLGNPTIHQYAPNLKQHPKVLYWLDKKKAAQSMAIAANSLPDPDIIIGFDNIPTDNFSMNDYLPTSTIIGFQQKIPNPALRESRSKEIELHGKLYQLQSDYQFQQLIAQFKIKLLKLKENRALETILRKKLSYFWSVEEELKGQLEAGASIYGRLSKVDIDRTDIHQQLNNLGAELMSIKSHLVHLVGEVPNIDYQFNPDSEAFTPWTPQANTPLYPIKIAKEGVVIAEKRRNTAKAAFKPNYDIKALYKIRDDSDQFNGDDWFSLQASVSLPLWSRSNQTPNLNATTYTLQSAKRTLDDTKLQWQHKMAVWFAEINASIKNIKLLEKQAKASEQIVLASKRNYEAGSDRLETVLKAQINQLSTQERLTKATYQYWSLLLTYNSHIVNSEPQKNT